MVVPSLQVNVVIGVIVIVTVVVTVATVVVTSYVLTVVDPLSFPFVAISPPRAAYPQMSIQLSA